MANVKATCTLCKNTDFSITVDATEYARNPNGFTAHATCNQCGKADISLGRDQSTFENVEMR